MSELKFKVGKTYKINDLKYEVEKRTPKTVTFKIYTPVYGDDLTKTYQYKETKTYRVIIATGNGNDIELVSNDSRINAAQEE